MAILSGSSSNWIFSLKVLLISTGVLSMAVFLKVSVPLVLEFLVSEVPVIWRSLLSWLTPPFLYVIINGIIITIAASSRFQKNIEEQETDPMVPVKNPVDIRSDFPLSVGYNAVVLKSPGEYGQTETRVSEVKTVMAAASEDEDDDFAISRSTWTPIRKDSREIPTEYSFLTEKPLVSARFGHRRSVKASPEGGKILGVAKPKRNDTLESTWKTITDGRPIPLARHLKKCDTWETHGRQEASPLKTMKKAETFNDRNNPPVSSLTPSPASGKLRKEPSLGQDELNRRVEAFIKKFNQEMRLQRQESLNQYKEMVNRRTL